MSKFDTHGGYFAPKDYLKVNEGGSHEENPNGGVQIGVDPEGNPNLLEEGEPVYKDYVYSDNIEAEKEFLEQNNLPGKYAGKLYSKIADDLFTEAEERPLDPISRNGLEALLGRLADAQEGQKQAKEQRDLEDELAQLSPEELDQLEAMLAQGEQPIDGVDAGAVGLAGPEGPEGIVQAPAEPMPVEGMPMMANGGFINRYPNGGWVDFMNRLAAYDYSRNPSNVTGKYAIDRRSDVWGGRTAEEIEADKAYRYFTNYVLAHSDDPDVQAYLHALDNGVADGVPLLFDGSDNLVKNWKTLFEDRRTDGDLGIYHLNPKDIGFLTAPAATAATVRGPQTGDASYWMPGGAWRGIRDYTITEQANPFTPVLPLSLPDRGGLFDINTSTGYRVENPNLGLPEFTLRNPLEPRGINPSDPIGRNSARLEAARTAARGIVVDDNLGSSPANSGTPVTDGNNSGRKGVSSLPTWPRYAGAVGSGLLGLYNAFQSPDRYEDARVQPILPEGRINLVNQVYNPIDQNMIANAQIAQGNATRRALGNSGLGPSAGAAILAADNNLTGNLGTGFIQSWDANNQRRNAVTAANNQAEAQRAQFDYGVDSARKQILNNTAYRNAQNDLMIQRLNNMAEGDKYTAISNQISNGLQALSGIGQENFAMNQVNTNPSYLGYHVAPNGTMRYMPWYACNGGLLKKFKK